MYKHILMPIALDHDHDHSQDFAVAQQLLAPDGRLSLLHVLEEIPSYVTSQLPVDLMVEGEADVKARIQAVADGLSVTAEPFVIHGSPGISIVDFAKKSGVDCIVMRSHRPELVDYLLGSAAARVVRHAMCSVHVLR